MSDWKETNFEGIVADLNNAVSEMQCQCNKQNPDSWERLAKDLRLNVGNFNTFADVNPGKGLTFGDVATIIETFANRATSLCEKDRGVRNKVLAWVSKERDNDLSDGYQESLDQLEAIAKEEQ